jgi:hypothetical protein
MRRLDISSAWRTASPRHRKVHLRGEWVEILLLFLRLASVALVSALGWVHLHLWLAGYRHIPTIGLLFLVAAVSGLAIAVGMLLRPSRLIGLLGFGLVIGILAGLIASINVGLFGFTESLSAPFAVESIVLEMAAAVILAGWVALDLMEDSRQSERATREESKVSASTMGGTRPSIGSIRLQGPDGDVKPIAGGGGRSRQARRSYGGPAGAVTSGDATVAYLNCSHVDLTGDGSDAAQCRSHLPGSPAA